MTHCTCTNIVAKDVKIFKYQLISQISQTIIALYWTPVTSDPLWSILLSSSNFSKIVGIKSFQLKMIKILTIWYSLYHEIHSEYVYKYLIHSSSFSRILSIK